MPNVTDFLTFLCYRRTHTLPANLNFNKLFVVTGERQKGDQNERTNVEKAKPGLLRSLAEADNNNKGDNFNLRVVLRRLFLNESYFKEETIVRKRGRKRSLETNDTRTGIKMKSKETDRKVASKSAKALKNVENLKKQPSKRRESKRLSKKSEPVIRSRPVASKKRVTRKTNKPQVKPKMKPSPPQKTKKQNSIKSTKNKIKFIRN